MRDAIEETDRRRAKQIAHNEANGIKPQALRKKIHDILDDIYREAEDTDTAVGGVSDGNITFDIDGTAFTVAADNIEKARLVPDWAALGLAPAIDKSGRDARPGKQKNPTKKPAAKPSRAE